MSICIYIASPLETLKRLLKERADRVNNFLEKYPACDKEQLHAHFTALATASTTTTNPTTDTSTVNSVTKDVIDSIMKIMETKEKIKECLPNINPSKMKIVENIYNKSVEYGANRIAMLILNTFFYPTVVEIKQHASIKEISMARITEFIKQQPQADVVSSQEHAAVMLYGLLAEEIHSAKESEKLHVTKREHHIKREVTICSDIISVLSFNIGSATNIPKDMRPNYAQFLQDIFPRLDCDINLIQECIWKKKYWDEILQGKDHTVNVIDGYHAGIAVAKNIKAEPHGDTFRWGCWLISVTAEQQELKFLSFSYHCSLEKNKEYRIQQFISKVTETCEEKRLPAIIGGDFNYDIRKITEWPDINPQDIRIYPETPASKKSIDFICVVHGESFETTITMLDECVTRFDIAKEVQVLQELKNVITTHSPLLGCIQLCHQC